MQHLIDKIDSSIETKEININQIVVKDIIQQRENLNDSRVQDYVEELSNGTVFPPSVVFYDGERFYLADGFHRDQAYRKSGTETVTVTIYEGSERDAILYAVGANSDHGLPRTNADKRKAVETLLKDVEWREWSDGAIAERCRVSRPFVGKIRNELTSNGYESSTIRKGEDGREYDISNIGPKSNEGQAEETSMEGKIESQQPVPDSIDEVVEGQSQPSEQAETGNALSVEAEDAMDEISETSGAEDNNDSDQDNTSESDESTSDQDDEPSTPETSDGQESQSETGLGETRDNDPVSDEESQNEDNDDGPAEDESANPELTSVQAPETNDVQALKAEIIKLNQIIVEKDQRIAELEKQVSELQENVKYYETEAADSLKTGPHEVPSDTEQMNYHGSFA